MTHLIKLKTKKTAIALAFTSILIGLYLGLTATSNAGEFNFEGIHKSRFLPNDFLKRIQNQKEEAGINSFLILADPKEDLKLIESINFQPGSLGLGKVKQSTFTGVGLNNFFNENSKEEFNENKFFLGENNITCKCPQASPGEKGLLNGVEFEAVDNALIRQRRDEGADMTKLCTSLVTDMSSLFNQTTFNQAIGNWDVSNVTDMSQMFKGTPFNQPIGDWDVSSLENMWQIFMASSFNQPIGNWNVSSVTDMREVFHANAYNHPLNDWNVSNVIDMGGMFADSKFNNDISRWDVSNVWNMGAMFFKSNFNKPIRFWNVRSLNTINEMFAQSQFNQDLTLWCVQNIQVEPSDFALNSPLSEENKPVWGTCPDIPKFYFDENNITCKCPDASPGEKGLLNGVEFEAVDNTLIRQRRDEGADMTKLCTSLVTDMKSLFVNLQSFNQPIGNWDVSNVTNMYRIFFGSGFNQPLDSWDVSSVTNMTEMFIRTPFNQPIGNWDVSNVTNMTQMFSNSQFNQPIGNWDVTSVTVMTAMFNNSLFNQDIGNWNVRNVKDMDMMFNDSPFNQEIGNWNVSSVTNMAAMFSSTPFNKPIGNWDVSRVVEMRDMFSNSQFNQPIENWDVSKLINMLRMFQNSQFNQDISSWCVSNINSEPENFSTSSPLTSDNKPVWGTCPSTVTSQNASASISSTDSEVGEGESIVISASIDAISTEEVLIYPSFSGSAVLGIDYTVAFESKGLELVAGGNGQGNNANQLNGPAPIVTFISEAEQAIYIADATSGRVIKWGFGAQTGQILINNPDVQTITDIYVDKNKNIYLVEQNASVVSRWIYPNYSQRQVLAGRLRENGSAANLLHMPYSFQVIEKDNQIEIFVSDAENHRVQKWVVGQNQGTTVAGGNGSGSTANQLFDPRKICVDEESNVFVLDSRNSRIQKWAKNATQGETVYQGNQYSVINDFDRDREGNWYLINRWPNINLTKYSPDFKKQYLLMDESMDSAYEFDTPTSIRVDAFGDAYIGDAGNFSVFKYNNTPKFKIPVGQTTASITLSAVDNDQFDGERSINIAIEDGRNIDFDPSQNVLISIKENDTPDPVVSLSTSKQEVGEGDSFDLTASLNQVSSRDAFINLSFGGAADLDVDFTVDFPTKGPRIVAGGNGSGSQLNQLANPLAVTVGSDGAIYTADENSQLAKWLPGKTEKEILPYAVSQVRDLHVDKDNNLYVLDEEGNNLMKFSPGSNIGVTVAGSASKTRGSSNSRFDTPLSLFVDDQGAMYVADHSNHRVQKWEPGATQGITVAGGNGEGSGPNQLRSPRAVTVGKDGAIYVSDANNQITKWLPGKAEKEVLPFNSSDSWDIHVDENDNLYILERWTHTLVKYAKGSSERIILAGKSDGSSGSSLDRLNDATSFYVDAAKNILIADKQNHRIVKYQFGPEIVIPKGQLTGGIVVKTLKDGRYEDDEAIQISVGNGINIEFDSDQSTSVLILDNDVAPEVTFELSADRITEGAQEALEIVARTKALSGKDIEILLSISEKSDAPAEKYEISNLTMRIAAGDSTARVLVNAAKYDDDTVDPLSKIILNVESINNAFTAQEEITILFEDDDFPQVTLTASPASIEEGGNFDLTATLNAVSSRDAIIALSFAGKAEFDSDYTVDFPTKGPSVVAGGNGEGEGLNQLRRPRAVAVGKDGSVYVSEEQNWQLSRWFPGKSEKQILNINTNGARAIHVDKDDNVYVLEEWGHKLVKYTAGSTSGTVIAGDPNGQSGDAMNRLNNPHGFFIADNGDVFIADQNNHRIQKWAKGATQGVTVAGGNSEGSASNQLSWPRTVTVDSKGMIYVSDNYGQITKWTPGKSEREIIQIPTNGARGLYMDKADNLYVLEEWGNKLVKYDSGTTAGVVIAGNANGESGNSVTRFNNPQGLAFDALGNVFIADQGNNRVVKYQLAPEILVPAGQMSASITIKTIDDEVHEGDETIELGISGGLNIVYDNLDSLTVSILDNDTPDPVVSITSSLTELEEGAEFQLTAELETVSSRDALIGLSFSGSAVFDQDYTVNFPTKGPSIVAGGNGEGDELNQLRRPRAVAVGKDGSVYVSDEGNYQLSRWYPGKAEKERLNINTNGARAIHVDKDDNVYVLEEYGNKLVKYSADSTSGTVIAGDPNSQSGDAANRLSNPQGFFIADNEDVYIVDHNNHRIQKWAKGATEGVTVAGGNGDGNASNQLSWPRAVTVDSEGILYVSDNTGFSKWTPGKSEKEKLQIPPRSARGLHIDQSNNLYVLEEWENKLVKYASGTTKGLVIAGDANGQSGNSIGRLSNPQGLAFDALGNVFIADLGNNRVVKYQLAPEILVPAGQMSGSITVKTIDDVSYEEDETIEMQIIGGRSIEFDSSQKVTTTILDNDQAPEITFELSSDRLVEASKDLVLLTANTKTIAGKDIEVFLSVSEESDAGPEKYEISSLKILISAGDSISSVSLKASDYDDDQVDILRRIVLSVDSVRNGFSDTEKLVILYESNDDPSFEMAASVSEVAEHLSFELTATLSAVSSRDALIGLSFAGIAEFDVDYTVDFPTKGPSVAAGGNGEGEGLNQLRRPRAVAVGKDGSVYVSEEQNWQLSRWFPGKSEKQVLNINTNGSRAIQVDQDDNIYVLEEWGNKLVKYSVDSTSGTVIAGDPNGQSGDALNRLSNPQGFFIADNGDIYIADETNHRIQKWAKGATEGVTVAGGKGQGDASNQLSGPRAVAVDSKGIIYVSDNNWGITKWTPGKPGKENLQIPSNGVRGLHVDRSNQLYVLEEWGNKVTKYDLETKKGIVIAGDATGQSGNSIGRLSNPQGLGFDALGNVFIADQGNNRVVKYQLAPEILVPAGSKTASIKINLIDDDINEPNETIKITGDVFMNTFPVSQDTLSVTILDNSKTLQLKDAPFIGLSNGAVAWGDFDRDGDMDVAVMGISPTSGAVTRLYENVDGKFVNTNQNFARFFDGDITWVDLNKDGWIDLVVSGLSSNKPETKVYLNVDGKFFQESVVYGLPKLFSTKMAWGDLDNDGDIDLAIAGIDENDQYIFEVYYKDDLEEKYIIEPEFLQNNNFNGFGESGFINGDLKIIDVDLDGDNDIVYSGESKSGAPIGGIVTNSYIRTGQFRIDQNWSNNEDRLRLQLKNSALVIDKLSSASMDQLGIITMGEDSEGKLYFSNSVGLQNNALDMSGNFSKLKNGSIALGDLNNDGFLDIVQVGEDEKGNPVSKIFLQRKSNQAFNMTSPTFMATPSLFEVWDVNLIGLRESTVNLVDYDMDGDLDLFLTGLDKDGLPRSILYESLIKNKSNKAPEKVSGLKFEDLGNGNVRFSWDVAQDDHSKNLGYNLRLGLTPGGDELSNVESDLATGYRLISKPATIYKNSFETQLDPGIYYWSVQAVDDGLLGGEFSDESGFTLVYEWKILNQGGIVDRDIQGLDSPVIKLGDLDGDGDLDLIYGSSKSGNVGVFKFDGKRMLKDNNSPLFVDRIVDAEVGDINGDGVLDILVNNFSYDGRFNFKIYISQPNGQYEVKEEQSLFNAKGKIIDLNNDGKSEIVISGLSSSTNQGVPRLFIFEYQGNEMPFKRTDISSQIAQLTSSAFDLGDFDNDQDIDYILTGFSTDGLRSYIYENTTDLGGSFKLTQTTNDIVPVRDGTIDFVDFDGDGDLDIIVTGTGASGDVFEVYMNQLDEGKSSWPRINLGLIAIRDGKIDLGDFNGDGYADLLYSGVVQGQGKVTKLAEFDPLNLTYRDSEFDVSDITDAEVEFGDIDGDGDLDFIISGNKRNENGQYLLRAYINVRSESAKVLEMQAGLEAFNSFDMGLNDHSFARLSDSPIDNFRLEQQTDFMVNDAPSIPEVAEVKILSDIILPNNKKAVELAWEPSSDDHTPSKGLTYALRVGTSSNGEEIVASNASQDGWRKTPGKGNAEHNLKWKLSLDPGTYYWSVQSVDASFAGSKFSQEGSFVVGDSGINSAPKLETKELDLIEFSKIGTKVGTLKGSDSEGHLFKWSISEGNENNWFTIDSLSGDLFVADQFAIDYSLQTFIEIQIQITDELGASSINNLRINVIEDVDSDGDGVKNNLDLCPGTILGSVVDEFGCSSVQSSFQLKLRNIVVKLGSAGNVQVNSADVDDGSYHPIPDVTFLLKLSKTNFNCTDLGLNIVEVTAEDSKGKVEKRFVEIVVVDDTKPVLKIKNSITVKLNGDGKATLKVEDIDDGSTDNCAISERKVSKSSFTCADLGASKVTFTVKDASGNTSSTEVTITVVDDVKPILKTKNNLTIKLDSEGKATLKVEDIDNGSTDNCAISERKVSKSSFTCADLGASKVTFTVKDASGNTSSTEVSITIVDDVKPILKTKNNLTIKLDSEGKATLKVEDIDNGSTDNCAISERKVSKSSFTCADLGASKVTFTVKDASGNTSSTEVSITVVDDVKPILKVKENISVKLDTEGKATLKWEDVDGGSTDNCAIKDRTLSKSAFTCADLGASKTVFTVKDASGNTSSVEVTVTVIDDIKPILKAKNNYNIKLDAEGKATLKWEDIDDGSTDNCSIKERKLSKTDFTRADSGENKVTYTITDSNGNSSVMELVVRVDIVLGNPERPVNPNAKVTAYPNPADDYLKIDFDEAINFNSIISTILTDASGKTINEILLDDLGNSEVGFSTAQLNPGIYFLRIGTQSKLYLIKFTVIH